MSRLHAAWMGAALALLLAACSGGGGGDDGDLSQDVGLALAQYVVVDLDARTVEGRRELGSLLGDAASRKNRIVFKRIDAGGVAGGSPSGSRWALGGETAGTVESGQVFVSVYEITRGQWRRLTGQEPWATAGSLVGASNEELPAVALSLEQAESGLGTANARFDGSFSLPTGEQWEYLARAGSAGLFTWGSSIDPTVADDHAVTADTAPGLAGPQVVGERQPNGFGLYDVHGNAWELTSDGQIRGGSWRDGLPMARCATRIALDRLTPNVLVGVRLLYRLETQ